MIGKVVTTVTTLLYGNILGMRVKTLIKGLVAVLFLALYYRYFIIPNYPFPAPPPDALQSHEPADTETPFRRAYFTNYTREQVIAHYKGQLKFLPTLELNYPPEDAQTIIRDQTRSWYLEELVHPFRGSLYINGFIPQQDQDTIVINDKTWAEKITIKYVPSPLYIRLIVASGILLFSYLIFKQWQKFLRFR